MAFSFRLKLQQKSELSEDMRRLAQKKENLRRRREQLEAIAEKKTSLPPKTKAQKEEEHDPNELPPMRSEKRLQEHRVSIAIENQAPYNLKRELTRNTLLFILLFGAVSGCSLWALKLLHVL